MKIYSYRKSNKLIEINIEVTIEDVNYILEHPQLITSSTYKGFELPDGPVIARQRDLITSQMISDYECFVDDVETLCEQNYGLIVTYENESDDLSHYYNFLATNDEGQVIAKVRLRLRIANHKAKRSKQQRYNKKSETKSEKLHELLTNEQIIKIATRSVEVIVNNEKFNSYEEAFDYANQLIKRSVEVMTR